MTANKYYKAYTLIEMLVVMSIFIVIGAIGFSAFYGMRDSLSMNEDILTLQQDFRYAQRSTMFLERTPQERWIYGIGVDLSTIQSDNTYKLFKWCSPFIDYGDIRTKTKLPHYLTTLDVGLVNANLPVSGKYSNSNCDEGVNVSEIIRIEKFGLSKISDSFKITLPSSNDASGDVGNAPVYILFESVSGRAFFYDSSGRLVNYTNTAQLVSNPVDLQIYIESSRTKVRRIVTIGNISGKINVQTENL